MIEFLVWFAGFLFGVGIGWRVYEHLYFRKMEVAFKKRDAAAKDLIDAQERALKTQAETIAYLRQFLFKGIVQTPTGIPQ